MHTCFILVYVIEGDLLMVCSTCGLLRTNTIYMRLYLPCSEVYKDLYFTHTEVDRCISKIRKVDWLPCYKIIQYHLAKLSPTSFTLHSSPPNITGASVRSCAVPPIMTGFDTRCCVGSNERTRLQLLITIFYLRRDTCINLIVKCVSFIQGLHFILTRAFKTLYSFTF